MSNKCKSWQSVTNDKNIEKLCIFEDDFQKAAKPVQNVETTTRADIPLRGVAFRRRASMIRGGTLAATHWPSQLCRPVSTRYFA